MCVHPSGEGKCVQKGQSLAFLQGFRKRIWFLNLCHLQQVKGQRKAFSRTGIGPLLPAHGRDVAS